MHPLKLKDISAALATEFELSSETIEKLARVYYKSVQEKLSGLTHVAVDVPKLGIFILKSRALSRKIVKTKSILHHLQDSITIRKFAIRSEKLDELEKLEKLEKLHETEQIRRKQIRTRRYEKPDQNLPDATPDS